MGTDVHMDAGDSSSPLCRSQGTRFVTKIVSKGFLSREGGLRTVEFTSEVMEIGVISSTPRKLTLEQKRQSKSASQNST